ncbi:MAG: hypothetical protein ACK56I_36535, partial [bacterium]
MAHYLERELRMSLGEGEASVGWPVFEELFARNSKVIKNLQAERTKWKEDKQKAQAEHAKVAAAKASAAAKAAATAKKTKGWEEELAKEAEEASCVYVFLFKS